MRQLPQPQNTCASQMFLSLILLQVIQQPIQSGRHLWVLLSIWKEKWGYLQCSVALKQRKTSSVPIFSPAHVFCLCMSQNSWNKKLFPKLPHFLVPAKCGRGSWWNQVSTTKITLHKHQSFIIYSYANVNVPLKNVSIQIAALAAPREILPHDTVIQASSFLPFY